MNCSAVLTGIDAEGADTAIETRFGPEPPPDPPPPLPLELETTRLALPCMAPDFAMMVVCPLPAALAMPAAFTDATLLSEDDHCTVAVTSLLLPSENVPVAENCWPDPAWIDAAPGVTRMEAREAGVPEFDPDEPLEPVWPPPLQALSASRAMTVKVKIHIRRTVFTLVSTGVFGPGFIWFCGECLYLNCGNSKSAHAQIGRVANYAGNRK